MAETMVGPWHVSTVFLGLNHGFWGPPLWFETMVFPSNKTIDYYQQRYATWEDAVVGHDQTVTLIVVGELPRKKEQRV